MSVNTVRKPGPDRIPPRRRRPRKTVWRRTVWPLVKLILIVTVVVIVGDIVATKVVRPFKLYSREYRETQQLSAEIEQLRNENAALDRRIKHLQTPRGVSRAARELGYVKPGEITLILPEDESKGKRIGNGE